MLVGCRGNTGKSHGLVRLARYEWSESEGIWERVDRHGSDDDWFLRLTPEGLEGYARPKFCCPKCKQPRVYEHDNLQSDLQRAAIDDGRLLI